MWCLVPRNHLMYIKDFAMVHLRTMF